MSRREGRMGWDATALQKAPEKGAASESVKTEPEMLAEFRWEGHWEVWESEWGGARWTEDDLKHLRLLKE
jgi:hypothetical protein